MGLLESALASDMTPKDVLLELIAPLALHRGALGARPVVGGRRAPGQRRGLATDQPDRRPLHPAGAKRGHVILCAPPGELHAAPVAIAADLLRWDGFEVVELGADTPADALAGTADRTDGLLAIGLACTTPQACASAKRDHRHAPRDRL